MTGVAEQAGQYPVTLVADIGGTNARFALLVPGQAELQFVRALPCADFDTLEAALMTYLALLEETGAPVPKAACLAVAGAVDSDRVRLTNNPWQFSQLQLSATLSLPLTVINDFSAQAWCLPAIDPDHLHWIQRPATRPDDPLQIWQSGARCVAGPGTGFGAATMTPSGDVLECEPGLCSFAPTSERQADLLRQLWKDHPRVCHDMLLSGGGLVNIHRGLARIDGNELPHTDSLLAADVLEAARQGDSRALESTHMFSAILGAVCGDLALIMGTSGGLFLSGNLLQRFGELFEQSVFMAAFNDKGPYSQWCRQVPVALWRLPQPGLAGCAAYVRARIG